MCCYPVQWRRCSSQSWVGNIRCTSGKTPHAYQPVHPCPVLPLFDSTVTVDGQVDLCSTAQTSCYIVAHTAAYTLVLTLLLTIDASGGRSANAFTKERVDTTPKLHFTLRALALRYTPSKATQLLVSPTDLRFKNAYLALGPTAAELLSYKVQEVTADPCSSVSVATALVSVMMVSKKEVSWVWVVSKGMLPTYSRLAALPAFSAAACGKVCRQGSVVVLVRVQ